MSDTLNTAPSAKNDVYRQPEMPADLQLVQEVESAFAGTEQNEQSGPHTHVTLIEAGIESLRRAATEENIPKSTAVDRARDALSKVLFPNKSRPVTLIDRLVEHESRIGGQKLKSAEGIISQRFWYHEGYWHYEETDVLGPMVARYQVVDGYLKKVDGATIIDFYKDEHVNEEANVLTMIRHYYAQIQQELYPGNKSL
jgi:hypothetical protein